MLIVCSPGQRVRGRAAASLRGIPLQWQTLVAPDGRPCVRGGRALILKFTYIRALIYLLWRYKFSIHFSIATMSSVYVRVCRIWIELKIKFPVYPTSLANILRQSINDCGSSEIGNSWESINNRRRSRSSLSSHTGTPTPFLLAEFKSFPVKWSFHYRFYLSVSRHADTQRRSRDALNCVIIKIKRNRMPIHRLVVCCKSHMRYVYFIVSRNQRWKNQLNVVMCAHSAQQNPEWHSVCKYVVLRPLLYDWFISSFVRSFVHLSDAFRSEQKRLINFMLQLDWNLVTFPKGWFKCYNNHIIILHFGFNCFQHFGHRNRVSKWSTSWTIQHLKITISFWQQQQQQRTGKKADITMLIQA